MWLPHPVVAALPQCVLLRLRPPFGYGSPTLWLRLVALWPLRNHWGPLDPPHGSKRQPPPQQLFQPRDVFRKERREQRRRLVIKRRLLRPLQQQRMNQKRPEPRRKQRRQPEPDPAALKNR